MRYIVFLFLIFALKISAYTQTFEYSYNLSGDRIHRQVIELKIPQTTTDTAATAPVEDQIGEMTIKVYPNPTKGILNIEIGYLPEGASGNICVYNLQGSELLRKEGIGTSNSMDFGGLPVGDYIMRMIIDGKRKEWKIVKN